MSLEDHPLPDPQSWQPHRREGHVLERSFFARCFELEELLKIRAHNERRHNFHNFESGSAVEELLRSELRRLLPARYSTCAGTLIDRHGASAGDCDVVIFNELWFPHALTGPTEDSRRTYYPIDGTYAVIEVKQTLTEKTLDEAMEKLVCCHRLYRPLVPMDRITENAQAGSCMHFIRNPLHSAIVAVDVGLGYHLDRLVERFFLINKKLKRLEVVHALCVLGHGTVQWGYFDDSGTLTPATYGREDLYKPIVPVYKPTTADESALYDYLTLLMGRLYHSVLGAEDIPAHYGWGPTQVSAPSDPSVHCIEPDPEWLAYLDSPCSGQSSRDLHHTATPSPPD